MKARDQQGEFNLKLMQSLERTEKKLDKESDSRKIGSRKNPERKRRSRSISRHRHHSLKYSNKEAHISSSPSPTGHEEIFPTVELFFSCRGKNFHLPT
jgi:hypothetical protein